MKLTLSRQAAILVGVPLAFEIILCVLLSVLFFQFDIARARLASARELTSHLTRLVGGFCNQTGPALFGTLADDEGFRRRLSKHRQTTDAELKELARLADLYPSEREVVTALIEDVNRFGRYLSAASNLTLDVDKEGATKAWVETVRYEDRLFQSFEKVLLRLRRVEQADVQFLSQYESFINQSLVWFVSINVLLTSFLLWFFNQTTVRQLKALSGNFWRFAANQSLNPPVGGVEEIVLLDLYFRRTAGTIAQARLRQRALIDNSADIICSIDSQLKFTQMSQACQAQWGYSAGELLQVRLSQIIYPADLESMMRSIDMARDGQEPTAVEARLRRKDGRLIDTSWSTIWSAREQTLYCVIHDVSELKRLAALKRQFVTLVREDLRKPLTIVQELHDLLMTHVFGRISQSGLDKLASLQREVLRLVGLVDSMLDIQRLDTGKLDLQLEQVFLSSILDASVQSVKSLAERRNICIELIAQADPSVAVDTRRLAQVVINLLTNAIKYSEPGSTIVVTSESSTESVTVSVIDQGRGVPEHLQQSIFERFKQVEAADERVRQGKGLGLAICKSLVEAHGGSIGVTSKQGTGSTFWISLPLSPTGAGVGETEL